MTDEQIACCKPEKSKAFDTLDKRVDTRFVILYL